MPGPKPGRACATRARPTPAGAADLARASGATFVILESVEWVGPSDDTPTLI